MRLGGFSMFQLVVGPGRSEGCLGVWAGQGEGQSQGRGRAALENASNTTAQLDTSHIVENGNPSKGLSS